MATDFVSSTDASGSSLVTTSPEACLVALSGSCVADRRYEYGMALRARGDLAAAADLFTQALEQAPDFVAAAFALGEVAEALGRREAAVAAFAQAVRADPADRLGASLRLMRLDAAPVAAMPGSYVATLFDQYAERFDAALTGQLGYRGPALLRAAVTRAAVAEVRPLHFARAVDLGCGTGLAAAAFADCVDAVWGVDLSPRMIAVAATKEIYARLEVGEMGAFLADLPARSIDLVIAADALVYVDELGPLFGAVAGALQPNGFFAFSLERHDGDGVSLGPTLRYAHSESYVRAQLAAAALRPVDIVSESTRSEAGQPVPSLIVVAAPRGAP